MKQRNTTGFVVGAGVHRAIAVILGLAIRQRQAVLADLVRALQQVTLAVHFAQGRLAGIVGEERVDALGGKTRTGQREPAHLCLHAIAETFGGDRVDTAVGIVRSLVGAVEPAVDLRPAQVELVGDLALGARVFLIGLAHRAVVVGVDRVHDPHGDAQAFH
ncbi:hypothetical protein D3C85_1395630 [compost metagenome]